MPSHIHFPPVFKPLIDPVVHIKLAESPSTGLAPGQTVEARVMEKLDGGRFIIRIGGNHLTAEAEPSLRPGQVLTLRVESLNPRVLLSVLAPPEERITADFLRGFRSNPEALPQGLAGLAEILGGKQGDVLARLAGRETTTALSEMLKAVLPVKEHFDRGFSLRDAARTLGMLLESDLKKALEGAGGDKAPVASTLKSNLMKLIDDLQGKIQLPGFDRSDARAVREMMPALEQTVRAVENQQVLNVHFQETEGKLFFQVPLLLPGLAGKANIFIHDESGRPGGEGRLKAFRVVFALDMDALGDVLAQAHFRDKDVVVRICCGNEETAAFVDGLLPQLEQQLIAAGCRVAELTARAEPGVRQAAEECFREEIFGDGQTLNLFA